MILPDMARRNALVTAPHPLTRSYVPSPGGNRGRLVSRRSAVVAGPSSAK